MQRATAKAAYLSAFRADDFTLTPFVAADATIHLCHPFGSGTVPDHLKQALTSLKTAFPDLERRDWIVMSGHDADGALWVGAGGHWMGTFAAPFLTIPPTHRAATMRYHEFYRIEGTQAVEAQIIWDIPELMLQAGVWPFAPSLGRELTVPGPMTQDGLTITGDGTKSAMLVTEMLTAMKRHPLSGGPEVMELPRYWHPKMNWYGPAGIGTARGIAGFRAHHQIPFLNAMPDRGGYPHLTKGHLFGEGAYAAVTGWPNMAQTLSGSGWLGLPATNTKITMRSLDFWRLEGELIRENWVMIDLLHVYAQLGLDPLARMAQMVNPAPTFEGVA